MNLFEVYRDFKTERDCHDYLIHIGWPDQVFCVYCKSTKVYRRTYENGSKGSCCNKSFTVTTGTIFHSSKLPLMKWFLAIVQILAAKKGISSLQLARTIDVNKNTAWFMQNRIMNAMSLDPLLSGIVEVDETYIGGALGNMKRSKKLKKNPFKSGMIHKIPVLGMIERVSGKVNLKVLKRADGLTIKPILKSQLSKDSTLVTDGFGGYYGIDQYFQKHVKMNHNKGKRREGAYNLGKIEVFFSTIKRAVIGQFYTLTKNYLQSYMDEIAFKQKIPPNIAFNFLLQRACAII